MQFDNSTLRVYPEIFSRNPEVRRLPTLPSFATQRAGSRMRAMMQNHTLPTRSWKPIEVDRRNSRARTVSKRPAPVVLVQAVSNVGEVSAQPVILVAPRMLRASKKTVCKLHRIILCFDLNLNWMLTMHQADLFLLLA